MFLNLKFLGPFRDVGLLILRIGLGTMFIIHGGTKLLAGPELWEKVGGAMGNFGISFAPTFWGLMAAMSEFGGGVCLVLGFFMRPACAFMAFTMAVALSMHFKNGDSIGTWSHAAEDGIVFLSLILIGPGRLSLDRG